MDIGQQGQLHGTNFPSPSGGGQGGGPSGVNAFVGVDEQNADRGGNRNRDEEPEDPPQIATHHERDDDQHRAQVDGIAEDLRRDEVVHDVRDDEVEDQHHHDLARGLRDEGGDGDRGEGAQERADEGNEGGHAGDDAERQRVRDADNPERHAGDQSDEGADDQLAAHVGAQHSVDIGGDLVSVSSVTLRHQVAEESPDDTGVFRQEERHQEDQDRLEDPVDQHEDVFHDRR